MQLKDCLSYLVYDFKNEAELLNSIEELSRKFTSDRGNISDYLKDSRLSAAYTAFYLMTNMPKLHGVFNWLSEEWKSYIMGLPLVDVGAGPGTFTLAMKELAGDQFNQSYQIENSEVMRAQALKLWQGLYPDEASKLIQSSPSNLEKSFMLFGHSANEMGAKVTLNYIDSIKSQEILFIEPGTKSFFPEMLKIRDGLIKRGYNILFPCPDKNTCPMEKSQSDWCHQFIHLTHSPEIERLCQKLHMDRKLLPLTVHAYSKTHHTQIKERIVRVHPPTKFSFEWDICQGENIHRYQVMKKDFIKQEQKEIEKILAGEGIATELIKELQGSKRVRFLGRVK